MSLSYRILERVASGGSGVVYRAQLDDSRVIAVKRFAAGYADELIVREASLLSRSGHRNIVEFFGVRRLRNSKLDLVMEWVGPSLSRLLRTGQLPLSVVIHIGLELLHALEHLSGQKHVHRDLSPRNVLLSPDGRVKLADFGLAKPENAPRSTRILRGSPPYISPEQINDGDVDARSDLFALGVLLYELITGTPPFRSSSHLARKPEILPVTMWRSDLPDGLADVVMRLLEYDRQKRYQSAREAIEALGAVLDTSLGASDLATLLRDRGLFRRPRRTLRRVAMAAAVAAVVLLVAGGVREYVWTAPKNSSAGAPVEREHGLLAPVLSPAHAAESLPVPSGPEVRSGGEAAHLEGSASQPEVSAEARRGAARPVPKSRIPRVPDKKVIEPKTRSTPENRDPVSAETAETRAPGASYEYFGTKGASYDVLRDREGNSGE